MLPPAASRQLNGMFRARRMVTTRWASFGARIVRPIFGIAATAQPRLNLLRIEEDLSEAHLRLAWGFIVQAL